MLAVPFVQGRLTDRFCSTAITSECAHCAAPLHLEIDSRLDIRVAEAGAEPWIRIPIVDVRRLRAPTIIDDF